MNRYKVQAPASAPDLALPSVHESSAGEPATRLTTSRPRPAWEGMGGPALNIYYRMNTIDSQDDYELLQEVDERARPDTGDALERAFRRILETSQRLPGAPRTHFQELVEPYLAFLRWDNATLDSDLKLFWLSAVRCDKRKPSGTVLRILEWAKDKNLHPKQVVKVFNKP